MLATRRLMKTLGGGLEEPKPKGHLKASHTLVPALRSSITPFDTKRCSVMSTIGTTEGPDLLALGDEELLLLFRDQGSLAARDELVKRHLPFTRHFAGKRAR